MIILKRVSIFRHSHVSRPNTLERSDRTIGFWWRPADNSPDHEQLGPFTLPQIQPFLSQLTQPKAYLLINFPNLNLDFTVLEDGEIEMEIMDSSPGRDHFALVTVTDAEIVTEVAIEHWGTDSLRPLLSDQALRWLT